MDVENVNIQMPLPNADNNSRNLARLKFPFVKDVENVPNKHHQLLPLPKIIAASPVCFQKPSFKLKWM